MVGRRLAAYIALGSQVYLATVSNLYPSLVDPETEDVEVTWIGTARPSFLEDELSPKSEDLSYIYLGQTGEITVLYEGVSNRVLRVPSQQVYLTSYADPTTEYQ
jgi:hypothetical protein